MPYKIQALHLIGWLLVENKLSLYHCQALLQCRARQAVDAVNIGVIQQGRQLAQAPNAAAAAIAGERHHIAAG